MPKPHSGSSVKEMRDYIRLHKLNHPAVKITMKKAELIAGLKKIGHWSARKPVASMGRPSAPKTSGRKMVKNKGRPSSKTPAKSGDMKGFLAGLPD
tara:strand:+ start:2847 stop:3134 length:288 start_codon:yes stop_codon:yes gene_type:complete